jgi:hypothetical protein
MKSSTSLILFAAVLAAPQASDRFIINIGLERNSVKTIVDGTGLVQTIMRPIQGSENGVNSWNTNKVVATSSTFVQVGCSLWTETYYYNTFNYTEDGRDACCVYLRDINNDMLVKIDIESNEVIFTGKFNEFYDDILEIWRNKLNYAYEIAGLENGVNGNNAIKVETSTDTYQQFSEDTWFVGMYESFFALIGRDDWSIHLLQNDNNIELVIDFKGMMVYELINGVHKTAVGEIMAVYRWSTIEDGDEEDAIENGEEWNDGLENDEETSTLQESGETETTEMECDDEGDITMTDSADELSTELSETASAVTPTEASIYESNWVETEIIHDIETTTKEVSIYESSWVETEIILDIETATKVTPTEVSIYESNWVETEIILDIETATKVTPTEVSIYESNWVETEITLDIETTTKVTPTEVSIYESSWVDTEITSESDTTTKVIPTEASIYESNWVETEITLDIETTTQVIPSEESIYESNWVETEITLDIETTTQVIPSEESIYESNWVETEITLDIETTTQVTPTEVSIYESSWVDTEITLDIETTAKVIPTEASIYESNWVDTEITSDSDTTTQLIPTEASISESSWVEATTTGESETPTEESTDEPYNEESFSVTVEDGFINWEESSNLMQPTRVVYEP